MGARRSGGPEGWGPGGVGARRVGGPKYIALFLLSPTGNFILSSLSGSFLVEFWWCLKRRDAQMYTFGLSGCRVKPRRPHATLAARVHLVIARLVLIFALPLDFHGRVRVVRSMYLLGALHEIETSLLASDSLRKLRSSICRVVWSRRQLMANVGAVLSLLDGLTGCDPAFCVVWFRFRLLCRYLAFWPSHVPGVYRLLEMVGEGCPGHGLLHLLSASAAEIGFRWNPDALAWARPGFASACNLAGCYS